jgi:SNF2 family DNA or RNA helicase
VLVFSTWTVVLHIFEALVQQRGFGSVRIDGQLSLTARRVAVGAFRDDDRCMFILPTVSVGSESLRLTRANHTMLVDRSYSPAAEEQASSRFYRSGQTHKVVVKWYIMAATVEEGLGRYIRISLETYIIRTIAFLSLWR